MSISSILFRGESEYYDAEAPQVPSVQVERRSRSLRRILKPWPFSSAPQPTKAADQDEDDDEDYREPTPAAVLDRLAQYTTRR